MGNNFQNNGGGFNRIVDRFAADEHLAMSLDANLSTEVTEDVDQGALGHADGL